MYTINPTKITSKFPILNPTTGVHRFGFSRTVQNPKNGFLKLGLVSKAVRCAIIRPANERCLDEAIEAVKDGKVIAVPTDTLYGFACDACSVEAINRIYEIKGRKLTSPLAICVGDVSDIGRFVVTDHLPFGLLESLLPGPVTVVLTRVHPRFAWLYASVQFLLVVLFGNIFYKVVKLHSMLAILLATFAGCGIAICCRCIVVEVMRLRRRHQRRSNQHRDTPIVETTPPSPSLSSDTPPLLIPPPPPPPPPPSNITSSNAVFHLESAQNEAASSTHLPPLPSLRSSPPKA